MTAACIELAARPGGGDVQRTGRVTQRRVLRSEWTKLWSLRSTRWSLAAGVLGLLLGIASSAFDMCAGTRCRCTCASTTSQSTTRRSAGTSRSWRSAMLGVLVVTGEYATGMVRSTFMAVPTRLPVLWAKVLVFASVVLVLAIPATFLDFFISASILTQHHVNPSLSPPHALRAVLGVPLFLSSNRR